MSFNNTEKKLPPDQRVIDKILRWGIDHPGITSDIPNINLDKYRLTIEGEVENPLQLNWDQILKLPKVVSVSDFHCVEGWSVLNCRWEGIQFKEIEKIVKPKDTAKAVTFQCADNYSTSLFRKEMANEDTILAYKLNGTKLEAGYGFPLRLVVPTKYAYKSAMWILKILFTSDKDLGFWEKRGYNDSANVHKNERFT